MSLGLAAEIVFTEKNSKTVTNHVATDGSIYNSMTRQSQDFYEHSLPKSSAMTESETRVSLTFRPVNWGYNNSTVIDGDSNTGGLKFAKPTSHFKGTFGIAMPRKLVETFMVKDVDPIKCVGYNYVLT